MNIHILVKSAALVAFAAALQGCGGGASSSPALPPGVPPVVGTASNALTTYSVFVGNAGAQSVVDVQPYGVSTTIASAVPAANAYVVYPDNSVQQVDALGNFDVSKSAWALQNVNILLANPNNQPVVDVFATAASNPAPEEVSVNAYGEGGSIVVAANALHVLDSVTGTSADLAHLTVTPQSASMMDNRTKIFHALAKDSNGALVQLAKAPVTWSVTRGAGCGAPLGKLRAVPYDNSTVVYVPPASGSAAANCPDQVVAGVAGGSVSHSGSANAFFYDPATSVMLGGTLKTAAGSPAANAVLNLYGGSAEGQKGALLVSTDGSGKFSRLIPATRILAPTAALTNGPDKTKAVFAAVSPSSVNPATAGIAIGSQNWSMTAQTVAVAPKPQPPYESLVRDANFYANAARDSFPLGAPNAGGAFPAGSIEFVLSHPAANQTGTITSGPYAGYTFRWDSTAKIATFTQGVSGGKVLTVTTGAASVNGQPCPSGALCFSYSRRAGGALDIDGAWSQAVSAGTFTVTYVRNDYNASHQTAGSPLYSHTISISQTLGTQNLTLTEQRFNSARKSLGTETVSRLAGTGNVLYTYSGTIHALSYKSDGNTIAVDYSLSNGVENKDYSGGFKVVITASPSTSDAGASTTFNIPVPAASAPLATGVVDGAGLGGLTTGHAASFTIASSGKVTLTKDPSLGANVITFTL